jgi:PAS domain S-box-containing protein
MSNDPSGTVPVRETASDALIVCDDQDRIIEVTRLACDLIGYAREDLISRPLQDLVISSEALEARRLLEKLQEEASIAFESSLRVKDGTAQPFHLRMSRLSVSGHRHSLVRVARRRRAADKLPEDRDFIRALLDTPGSLLIVLDHEGRVAFFNKACETATGRSFRDLRGKGLWELASDEAETMRLRAAFGDLGRGSFPARMECGWRTGEGKTIRTAWSSTLLLNPDNSVRHVIGTGLVLAGDEAVRAAKAPEVGSERALVEQALEESEARFRRFAESAEDLIYRYRIAPKPAYEYLSPAVLKLTGFLPDEYYRDAELGFKVLHPNDRALIDDIVRTGRVPDKPLTLRWIRKDGRQLWMEQRNVAVRDASGRLVAIEGIARDITERRRTERCRSAQYEVDRILSEASSFADAAPRILRSIQQCFDWELGTIWLLDSTANVLRPADLRPGSDGPGRERDARNALPALRPGEGLAGRVWAEGRAVWIPDPSREPSEGVRASLGFPITLGNQGLGVFEFRSAEIAPPDAEVFELFSSIGSQIGQFIERRRVEQRQSTQYSVTRILAEASTFEGAAPAILEAVCRSLGWEVGAVWLVDRQRDVLRLNVLWCGGTVQVPEFHAASRGTTLRRGASLAGSVWEAGKPLWIHDIATHPEFELSPMAARDGLHGSFGFPILLGSEVLGVLEFLSREVRQPDGEMLAMIGSIGSQVGQFIERKTVEAEVRRLNENLERRVAERTAQLAEAVREMSSFTYTIAHDLRAPLRSMTGFCQAIIDDYGRAMDPTCLDYARRVSASAQRMDALIRDLLTYGRLIHLEVDPEPVDLDALVRAIVEELAAELTRREAVIKLARPLGKVQGNAGMLSQVILNLVTNAIKFVAPGTPPRVMLRSEHRGARLRLWVEDNGIGIAPEFHARIFGIFERLNREEEFPGTGIGLAIVRKALERMGGQAGVESAAGKGSRFWIELPAA